MFEPMERAQLDAFLSTLPALTLEKKIKLFIKMRAVKAAVNRQAKLAEAQLKEIMETCENMMLAKAKEDGVGGFTTDLATTFTAEVATISIADDAAFFQFVLAQGDLDFFERRVSSRHVEEYLKNNPDNPPPGLNIFREKVMRVRAKNEK
jgi:hypothetical protein